MINKWDLKWQMSMVEICVAVMAESALSIINSFVHKKGSNRNESYTGLQGGKGGP